jgi:hypothetical protein
MIIIETFERWRQPRAPPRGARNSSRMRTVRFHRPGRKERTVRRIANRLRKFDIANAIVDQRQSRSASLRKNVPKNGSATDAPCATGGSSGARLIAITRF